MGKVAAATFLNPETLKQALIFTVILLVVVFFVLKGKSIIATLKRNLELASAPAPTEEDKMNAKLIDAAFHTGPGGWFEDEDKVISVVKKYTVDTYKVLRKAYLSLFDADLNDLLKEYLSSTDYAQIAEIVA